MRIFIMLMLLCASAFSAVRPAKIVADFEADMEDNDNLQENVNQALDSLITFTVKTLTDNGYEMDAYQIQSDWFYTYNRDAFGTVSDHGIPDHPPLLKWLDEIMQKVIKDIGRPACVDLHICDLYTFNQTIPVAWNVFKGQCNFPMSVAGSREDENRRCMVTDGTFDGLYAVVVFWVTEGSCLAAGGNMICGLLAGMSEGICQDFVCGPLADRIYVKKCGETIY